MKPSEIFGGPNSSLRKTFDRATNSPDSIPSKEEAYQSVIEEQAREFCKATPRVNPESGVAFYERLKKYSEELVLTAEKRGYEKGQSAKDKEVRSAIKRERAMILGCVPESIGVNGFLVYPREATLQAVAKLGKLTNIKLI